MQPLLFPALAQAAAVHDTVLVHTVPAAATGIQQFVAVAEAGAVLLVYAVVILAVWAVIRLRRTLEAARSLDRGRGPGPHTLAANASRISRASRMSPRA